MLTIRSDYSPQAAPEKQELDNLKAIQTLLVIAGLSTKELVKYNKVTEAAAIAYEEALGAPDQVRELGHNIHSKEQWEAAKLAAQPNLYVAEQILITAGVTIENKLKESNNDQMFSEIITSVYNDYSNMELVAMIIRAIVDEESETYIDNRTGYGNQEIIGV